MNGHVHYGLTRRWAVEAGFSEREADAIAAADLGVDTEHPGGLFRPFNWSYHYRLFGARALAARGVRAARESGSLRELGIALHRAQDDIAHGWLGLLSHAIDPRVDVWEHRSPRVRALVEERSRRMMRAVVTQRGKGRFRRG